MVEQLRRFWRSGNKTQHPQPLQVCCKAKIDPKQFPLRQNQPRRNGPDFYVTLTSNPVSKNHKPLNFWGKRDCSAQKYEEIKGIRNKICNNGFR